MITSDKPWSAKGHNLLDAFGTPIATFLDFENLDHVVNCVNKNEKLLRKIDELRTKIDELEETVPNSYNII